jgi:hypothetical protein
MMASNVNKTKILKFVDGADPAKGGFLNVAELMHDVVKQMTNGGGFVVRHCSTLDTIQNTTPWGTINSSGQWVPGAAPPLVGSPPSGSHLEGVAPNTTSVFNSVSVSPRASITLEAGGPGVLPGGGSIPATQATWVDYLNPISAPWTLPVNTALFNAIITPNPEDGGATGTMTVTGNVTGLIRVGQVVTGPGIIAGTTITALGTGTNLAGTYIVTPGQAIQLQQLETITGQSGALSFKGYINGTTLSVTSVTAGTIAVGNTITGNFTGTSPAAAILASTTIVRQLSAFGTAAASTTIFGIVTTTTTSAPGLTTTTTSAPTTTTTAAPSSSIIVSSATGIAAGQLVAGVGIPLGTFVASSYTSGTTINLVDSANAAVTLALSAGTAVRFFTPGKAGTYVVSQSQTIPAVLRTVPLQADTVATYSLLNEAWRVRFELLNNECVAAYVGTPLQLPGWADSTTTPKTPESWGIPGTVAKLTDPRGVVVDSAGAIGSRQFVSTCYTVKGATVGTSSATAPTSVTAISATGVLTLPAGKAATFKQGQAITFTNEKVAQSPLAATGTTALIYQQTYYVLTDVIIPALSVQITDSYVNALAGTTASFTAGTITNGNISIDASPASGKNFTAGDVIYIKDPIFTTTVGYTGTVFLKVDAVDSNGGVLSLSVINGGALVKKLSTAMTEAEKARAPKDPTAGIPITGTFYNLNSGKVYPIPALTTTTTSAPSGTTTTQAPSALYGGSGLLLSLTLANSVPDVGPGAGGYVDEIDSYQGFFNRGQRVGPHGDSYPLKYYLSISNNGFFLGIFESNWATTVGGTGTFSKFTAALTMGDPKKSPYVKNATTGAITGALDNSPTNSPPFLYAQNVLGTITPGMLLSGDTRIAGGTRILDYLDPNVLTDPLAGNGDSGRYILSASPSKVLGYYNTVTKLIQGDVPDGRTIRNPPIQLRAASGDSRFNWMLVQRPVNRTTGVILDDYQSLTSKHPVFCINSVAGRYYHFSVREKDISHPQSGPSDHTSIAYYKDFIQYPTPGDYDDYPYRIPSGLNSEDSHLLFNPQNQISLTEDKTYLISFPNNLTTPRFRYTEEIDMIGFTSSDILMSGQLVSFSTYDEPQERIYIALPPSNRYNTGVRFCVLLQTGNI